MFCSASIENDINNYRLNIGLNKLTINKTLQRTACFKVNDMIKWKYFSHTNPFGDSMKDILARFNINYHHYLSGEILAYDYTVDIVLEKWIASPTHKDVIIDKNFTKVGCANKLNYIVCHFTN